MPTISEHDALPKGTRLGEFEIQQVLGIGGFGVVYLAFDHALERQVAIKEYMPAALASRGFGSEIVVRSAAHADTFTLGMQSFINEARLLARFDHASLVKVYRFWEQHGTAYMVMPYYRGRTLQDVRREMDGPPDEAWLRRLIAPLLGALECLHRENVFHRDVAPDNILLLDDEEAGPAAGAPVLLDLGAARRVIGDHTQTLTAIVKPSFAPIEQYAETAQLRQGPWTDLYALAAVVHFCITGRAPMPATARTVHDELPTLRALCEAQLEGVGGHFGETFVAAIDHALAVRPQARPASVAAWRAELNGAAATVAAGKAEQPSKVAAPPMRPQRVEPMVSERMAAMVAGMAEEAYMTTIPAGRLKMPATVPAAATLATPVMVNDDIPPTYRLDRRADVRAPEGAEAAVEPLAAEPIASLRAAMAANVAAIPHTIPIARPAGAHLQQPAQPVHASKAAQVAAFASDEMPVTVPDGPHASLAARAGSGEPPASELFEEEAPVSVTPAIVVNERLTSQVRGPMPSWLQWTFAALLLSLGMAIWWSQQHGKAVGMEGLDARSPATADSSLVARMDKPPAAGVMSGVLTGESEVRARAERAATERRGAATNAARKGEAVERTEASGPLNPRKACGDKSFIFLAVCMKRYCSRPAYSGHAECVRMQELEASQRNNYYP